MAGQKGQESSRPTSRADMQQGPRSTASTPAAEGRQPSSVASGRAARATGGQHGQSAGRGVPGRVQQPAEVEQLDQGEEFDQGEEHEGTGGTHGREVATAGGGGHLAGGGQHMEIFGNLKKTLLKQSLLWHARAIGDMLGVEPADVVEVLGEVADEYANG